VLLGVTSEVLPEAVSEVLAGVVSEERVGAVSGIEFVGKAEVPLGWVLGAVVAGFLFVGKL